MTQRLILATGFSVFPGAPENPTAWAMAELARTDWQPEGARLVTRTLPVRFDMWESEFGPLLAQTRPDAIVAFGLSAKATGVTLEQAAHNRVALDRPDFTGACSSSDCVIDGGAPTLPTRLPLREIAAALRNADVPVSHSDTAGDYLCNLLFYRLVHTGPRVTGFIHVPYLDTQVARLRAAGHMLECGSTLSEAQLLNAVKIVIDCCVRAAQTPEGAKHK